jgi:hypothetical protein
MKVAVQKAVIDISMVLKPSRQLWPWEVPVVQEKYGEGRVQLLDAVEVERDSLPEPHDEFTRLGIMYGTDGGDGGTNISFVEMAYGRGKAGVSALQKAIEASQIGAPKRRKPRKKAKAKKAEVVDPLPPVVEDEEGDPLAA